MNKSTKNKLIKISEKYNLEFLVLFGSRAKGNFTEESDWDFAYYSSKKVDKIKLWNELEIIFKNVDLVEINGATSIYLKKEICENFKIIYEKREGLFEDFRDLVYFEYNDNLEYLKEYEKYLENNLKI